MSTKCPVLVFSAESIFAGVIGIGICPDSGIVDSCFVFYYAIVPMTVDTF